MRKRLFCMLLAILMATSLLPMTALAADGDGILMTLLFDEEHCDVVVKDRNNDNIRVQSGETLKKDDSGEACGEFIINVKNSYRIEKVIFDGKDMTYDYIIGVYGRKPMQYVHRDFTMEVQTAPIPDDLPTVTEVRLYADEEYTRPIDNNLTLTNEESVNVYVKAVYSDGREYPAYTARGYMEYSIDGKNWDTTTFGGCYPYFPVKSCQYDDKHDLNSTKYDNYDYRIRIEPDGLYCTGDVIYSDIYHINGGASAPAVTPTPEATPTPTPDEGGCLVTFNVPDGLCEMQANLLDDSEIIYHSGDRLPADSFVGYKIFNIADGYRIKSVTMNGKARTSGFINGGYGEIGTTIDEDTTITVELEPIPEVLPSVDSVTLYFIDKEEIVSGTIEINKDTRFAGVAAYSDGVAYPEYFIGGVWEYSADGISWTQDTVWGRNRYDYWPGWSSRSEFDPEIYEFLVNGSYDLRLRVTPRDLYTTGEEVVSNTIHINGGAAVTPEATPAPTPEATPTPAPTPEVFSGTCGDGIAWEFEDGTLSIIGTGSMQNFKVGEAPWAALQSEIKALDIYEGITELGENCFDVCTTLTDVFYGGSESAWKQLTIPAGNDILSTVTVHFDDTLTWSVDNGTLTISGEGNMMDYALFSDGTMPPWSEQDMEITAVVIEDGVASIGKNAFAWTNDITQITLGKNVALIGRNAFGNCDAISQVDIAEGNKHFTMKDGALCSADGTRLLVFLVTAEVFEYTIPDGITVIGSEAFYYNPVIKTVILPEGVTTIEDGAFDGTFLDRIYIPKSVTEMGTCIVYAGNLHQEIHYAGTEAEWEQISKNESYASYHTVIFESPAPAPEVTPAPTPEVTPAPTPEVTPAPTPEVTPAPTPEVTPAPTPEVTPAPTPEVTPAPTPAPADNPFEDVAEDAWYAAPVLWAVQNGITSGTSATNFGPEDPCTRGAIVTFLWAAEGRPEPAPAENPFADVSETDWYYKPIMWAVQQGITGGTSETTFSPNDPCTRTQVATFLWAAKGKPETTATESSFLDVAVTDWFFKPVMWAVENQITSGIGEGLFGSEYVCTRAQIATFLYKVYG